MLNNRFVLEFQKIIELGKLSIVLLSCKPISNRNIDSALIIYKLSLFIIWHNPSLSATGSN